MSPTHQSNEARAASGAAEHASLEIDGRTLEVVHLEGHESLSELFRFTCTTRLAPAVEAHRLLGQDARLVLSDGFGGARTVEGLVTAFRAHHHPNGASAELDIEPHAQLLSVGRACRCFQDSSPVDVVRAVLEESGVAFRFELVHAYEAVEYIAQYREDDWSFAQRLLRAEGIYTYFDFAGATTLVVCDDAKRAHDLEGGATVHWAPASGVRAPHETIEELARELAVTPTRFTVASFDPRRPALRILESSGSGAREVYRAPGANPERPEVCTRRARVLDEEMGARRSVHVGLGRTVRLAPGFVFELLDPPPHLSSKQAPATDRFFVTSVRTTIEQRSRFGEKGARPLASRFRALAAGTPFRPSPAAVVARQAGLQAGTVVGPKGREVHPDDLGRVRVRLAWDRAGDEQLPGRWMRVAQRGTAESMLLPRIGWTVLTYNEEGAVDAPSVLARIFDGEHLPPYKLPENKTRVVWKTATSPVDGSTNELRFEDALGREEVFVNASQDMNVLVQRLHEDFVVRDRSRAVGNDEKLSIVSSSSSTTARNQEVTVGANDALETGKGRSVIVRGGETESVGGMRLVRTGAGVTIGATTTRAVTVGAAQLDVTVGGISTASDGSLALSVGGAALRLTPNAIRETVGRASAQLVGGLKLERAADARMIAVEGDYIETAGAAMILTTDGPFAEQAEDRASLRALGALAWKAPKVVIEAAERVEIRSGGSAVIILPDAVEFEAPKLELADGATISWITNLIEHN